MIRAHAGALSNSLQEPETLPVQSVQVSDVPSILSKQTSLGRQSNTTKQEMGQICRARDMCVNLGMGSCHLLEPLMLRMWVEHVHVTRANMFRYSSGLEHIKSQVCAQLQIFTD